MKKLLVVTTLVLSSIPILAQQADSSADPIVIRIGDVVVHRSEFEAMVESLPPEYGVYLQQPGAKRVFAKNFVEMKVLAIEAEKRGVDKEPAVATQLKLTRDNTLASAMVARVEGGIQPTDSEIASRYETKKADYEQVAARHILIAFEGSPAARPEKTRTDEEAKALAEKLRADIVGGADFAEVARAESDDTLSAEQGGSLGTFGRGEMVAEFEHAVFDGKVGEIGEVVRTEFGYHIIEVTNHSSKELSEVGDEIRQELVREELRTRLDALTSGFEVTYEDAYFGPDEIGSGEAGNESSGSGN